MAITVTTVHAGANMFICDIEATADGDTSTGPIAHGLGAAPLELVIAPLLNAGGLSIWAVTSIDATNIELTKGAVTGSGSAGNQVRVLVALPHSIVS